MIFQDFLVGSGGYYAHFHASLALLGAFLDFFGVFWDFSVFFLGYVFLGHTSYNVAARQNKMFFQDFLVVSGGYYAHFHAILALLGAFLDFFGLFWDFFYIFSWLSFSWSNVL